MTKQKFYTVWKGRIPGVYDSWDSCKAQVSDFMGAVYKSFPTKDEAEKALRSDSRHYVGLGIKKEPKQNLTVGRPLADSISVDGAWNTATGDAEYQGVYTRTGDLLFHGGPFFDGTNNIVEFLAIVHALAFCKKQQLNHPIYSDSRNAISWVKAKTARTKLQQTARNAKIFEMISRAEHWLQNNRYANQILKWETEAWGENPADFGRK